MHIIYRVINNKTRKFYIGRTKQGIRKRWSVHIAHAKYGHRYKGHTSSYLQKSIKKHGEENFDIKEIDRCETFEDAVRLELFYIKYYNSENPKYGYNLTHDHGNGYESMNRESREKLSLSLHNANKKEKVPFDKARQKWVCKVSFEGGVIAKRFSSEIEAKRALDIVNITKFGDKANLHFSRESYSEEEIEETLKKLKITKKRRSKFVGVYSCFIKKTNEYFYAVRCNKGKIHYGSFENEEEAAKVYDVCEFYISRDPSRINFPENVVDLTESELKEKHDSYAAKVKNENNFAKKTSKYHHIQRHNKKWRFFITHDGRKFQSQVFPTELEAAKAYNAYAIQLLGDRAELNEIN